MASENCVVTRRLAKELQRLKKDTNKSEFTINPTDDPKCFEAVIIGPNGTPYEGGIFKLIINIPDKYPFVPPLVKFKTPIYHPNIDTHGRICLDLLKCEPFGNWAPAVGIANVVTSIMAIISHPSGEHPLMDNIATEFMYNKAKFEKTARSWTAKYANGGDMVVLDIHPTKAENIHLKRGNKEEVKEENINLENEKINLENETIDLEKETIDLDKKIEGSEKIDITDLNNDVGKMIKMVVEKIEREQETIGKKEETIGTKE